ASTSASTGGRCRQELEPVGWADLAPLGPPLPAPAGMPVPRKTALGSFVSDPMEHIPAIHAAKVGMQYPGRVVALWEAGLDLELDLSRFAPGRDPRLLANFRFDRTVA